MADTAEIGETQKAVQRSGAQMLQDTIRPPDVDRDRTALTEAERAAEEARSTVAHADPLMAVISDSLAGRTDRWLDQLAAGGDLPADHRVAFAADEARGSVDQLLRTAELAGHDPEQVLRRAVTAAMNDRPLHRVLQRRSCAYQGSSRWAASRTKSTSGTSPSFGTMYSLICDA